MKEKKIANLLIIGVFKGGTTSLFKYLADHPDICGSSKKETHYFSPLVYLNGEMEPISTYREYFKNCTETKYRLEATPSYLYGNSRIIKALDQTLADNYRLIVLLRNPTDRFISYYHYIKSRFLIEENMSFEDFVHECKKQDDLSKSMRVGHYKNAFKEGMYAQFLIPWIKKFPKSRLKIVFFDDLIQKPQNMVFNIAKWLDIDENYYNSYDFSIQNKTVMPDNKYFHKVAVKMNMLLSNFWRKNEYLKTNLREFYYYLNSSKRGKESISQATKVELNLFFKPHNNELRETLLDFNSDIDLPLWLEK